jgi:ABC-2 type transport system permease protein
VALMAKSSGYILTRGRAAQIASFVGITGLITGLIGLVWRSGSTANYALVALIVGGLGITLWAGLTPREFRETITGKRVRYGTVTVVSLGLLIGIVVLAYMLLQSASLTLDLTQNQSFTLSQETLNVLRRVTRPMRLTGFYTARNLNARELDDQFFRLYTAATNGLIEREYIDPEQNPAVADRFGVQQDGQLYISYLDASGQIDMTTVSRVPRGESQERDVTQAISRMLIAGTIKIYFATGADQRDAFDTAADGIAGVNSGIRESGLLTDNLNISQIAQAGGDIPNDAAAVIFARPLRDLTEAETGVISRYMASGGGLFLLPDVTYNDNPFMAESGAFNTYLWETFGVRALDAAVIDPDASAASQLDIISAVVFTESPIAARVNPEAGTQTLFRVARVVEADLVTTPPNVANGRIIMTTPFGYGERNLSALGATNTFGFNEGEDIPGPVTTAVWATNQTTGARIVLIGDSDFISNGQVLSAPGNGILFTDALAWVSGFSDQIEFAPQAFTAGLPTVFVSQQQVDLVVFITVVLVPGILIVSGLAIYARRVRR